MKESLNFFIVTDTHCYANELTDMGEAYEARSYTDQHCLAETGAIIDRAFELLAADDSTQIVLMPGDLSRDGEKLSHIRFLEKLQTLRESGKKIYVITARHDYNEKAEGFRGSERIPVEGTRRDELVDMYWDYGFSDALVLDRHHLSYTAQLADGVRLLALNCDGDCGSFKGFPPEQLDWIFAQIAAAKAAGDFIFAMTHYPVLPGSPIMGFIEDAVLTDWDAVTTQLADAGLPLMFTGHMHMQSVNKKTTAQGNALYDICTGSLVGYPSAMRKVTLHPDLTMEVRSFAVDDFDWDKDGKTAEGYFIWRFERMIRDKIDAMQSRPAEFLGIFGASSQNRILLALIRFLGKRLYALTLGKAARLLLFRCPPEIRDLKLLDKAVELVRSVFMGDQPYTAGMPEHEFVRKLLRRLRPIIRILEKKLGAKQPILRDIPALVLSLIGKDLKIDSNARIDLKNFREEEL